METELVQLAREAVAALQVANSTILTEALGGVLGPCSNGSGMPLDKYWPEILGRREASDPAEGASTPGRILRSLHRCQVKCVENSLDN